MSNAKVQSIEALQVFCEYLHTFRHSLIKELEALDLELRKLSQWINDEAPHYWQTQQQSNARKLEEYLQQLSRCMSHVRSDEQRPCTEEKKRVAKAKDRAQLCESKIRLSKAASLHWESRVGKISTKLQRSRDVAEAELQVAIDHLRRHLELLESYTRLRSDGLRAAELPGKSLPPETPFSDMTSSEPSRDPHGSLDISLDSTTDLRLPLDRNRQENAAEGAP
jgi:hypothetical protein